MATTTQRMNEETARLIISRLNNRGDVFRSGGRAYIEQHEGVISLRVSYRDGRDRFVLSRKTWLQFAQALYGIGSFWLASQDINTL